MSFKLLGINGSPKKPSEKSNTHYLLSLALKSAEEQGIETELLNLNEYNISECIGCEVCTTKKCPLDQKDDYEKIETKLIEADGIIIASPSYWSSVPTQLKNLMDRSRDLKMPVQKLSNKLLSAIAVSGLRVGGQESVVSTIINWGLAHGMIIIGNTGNPWYNAPFAFGTIQYDLVTEDGQQKVKFRHVKKDPIATKDATLLGERIASIGKLISPVLKNYNKSSTKSK